MQHSEKSLEAIQDIKRIMERSSRFISLSGWSGVAAGISALAGAWFAQRLLSMPRQVEEHPVAGLDHLAIQLIRIAIIVFIAAFISALTFTYLRSRKTGVPVWGMSARRLIWNTMIPLIAGGFVIIRIIQAGFYGLVAPACLVFYGLALVNGSKYTLGEVRWLGYAQIGLGIINLWMPRQSLLFWAVGFGAFHIVYGLAMWWKHERR